MDLTNLKDYLNSVDPSCSEIKIGIEITQKPCGDSGTDGGSDVGVVGTSGTSGTSGNTVVGSSGTSGTSGTIFIASTGGASGTSGTSGRDGRDATGGGGDSMFSVGWINVADYGAQGGADSTLAFKNAIQAAIDNGYHKIWIPASADPYIIKETIKFPGNFRAWVVKGAGNADGGAIEKRTKILWQGKQGACFNFVATRLGYIADFEIEGENDRPYDVVEKYRNKVECWNPQYWVEDGFSIDRYTAHSGISFDQDQLTPPWAAQTQIERVKITRCGVGFNISPSQGNMQADTIWLKDTKVENCVYGYAINQDQCRAITLENVWVNNCYTTFTNNKFGRGNGSAFNIFGGQVTTCFKIFECTEAYAGQCSINGLFAEACGILGAWQPLGVNENPVVFTACEFGLDDSGWDDNSSLHWITPLSTFEGDGLNSTFIGCKFRSKKDILGFIGGTFINTQFTELNNLFFSNRFDVSITGKARFNNSKTKFQDHVELHESQKWYVRPELKTVRTYTNNENVYPRNKMYNAESYIGTWYNVTYRMLPDNNPETFTWDLPQNEAEQFQIGDYINGYVGNTHQISGMGLKFGGSYVPAWKVISKNGNSVTFRKTSPEIESNSTGVDNHSGLVFSGNKGWICGATIEVLEDGQEVSVKNGDRLDVGDICVINGQATRVVSVGTKIKFAHQVTKGIIKSVSI